MDLLNRYIKAYKAVLDYNCLVQWRMDALVAVRDNLKLEIKMRYIIFKNQK